MSRPARSRSKRSPKKAGKEERKPLWLEQGKRLAEVLAEKGIGKSEFAERLAQRSKRPLRYYHVHRWTLGFGFGPDAQALAASELGLASVVFDQPDEAKRLEHETQSVLRKFEQHKIAEALTEQDWKVIRSIRFGDAELRPSITFYRVVALALIGVIRHEEIEDVAAENAALEAALAHKPPLRLK